MSPQIIDLKTLFDSKGQDYVSGLLDKFVVIKERTKGTNIHVTINEDGDIKFYKGPNKELTLIERTLTSIYEYPIEKLTESFHSLWASKSEFPYNYRFCFRYLNESKELFLEEIRIHESNSKKRFIEDKTILEQWANELNINGTSIIYFGRLNKGIREGILESLVESNLDIYDILKANKNRSESLTMKFLDRVNENISAKVLNPEIKPTKTKNNTSSDTYSIALQDVLAFLNSVNFDKYKPIGTNKAERILNLISQLYVAYMKDNANKFEGMKDLDGPNFAKDIPEFSINLNDVVSKEAAKMIKDSDINRELFKLFLGTFTKRRKRTSLLIDDNTKFEINKMVDLIADRSIDKPKNTETVPTFEEYYYTKYQKRALLNESMITEGKLDLTHKEPGKKPVNILVGRFQPPTLGHIKVLRKMHAENNLPCVVVNVRSKSGKNQKFEPETILKIWMDIAKQYSFIDAIRESNTGFLDQVLNALRPQYEPVLWGTGTDRIKGYERIIKDYGPEANVLPDFKAYEIKRSGKNISATQVRETILADNEKEFKKLTPKAEWKFWKQLKLELDQSK